MATRAMSHLGPKTINVVKGGAKVTGGVQLKRRIGLFSATAIVVANMIGTGIFTTSGFALKEVGSADALLSCWLLGGIFAFCGALCYGELGARFPYAGGDYIYLREAFGKPMAFLSGWISLIVGFSAPIAAAAMAFATYLLKALGVQSGSPSAMPPDGVSPAGFYLPILTAVSVVLLLSLLHIHSLRTGSRVQNLLTLFKIVLVTAFIGAGLSSGKGSAGHFHSGVSLAALSDGRFAVALIFITFAYSGWNAAAYLGGEIRRPQRNIPLALLAGTGIVTVLYLLMNAVYIYALPAEQMSGVMAVGDMAATRLFGPAVGRWFSGAIALGLLSLISAMTLAGPRVYYAMSLDGVFFHCFKNIHPRRHTPCYAIGLQALVAILMIVTAAYDKLLIYMGFTLSLFAILTVVGLMRLRRKGPAAAYRAWGYPVTPLAFILGNTWIVVFSLKSRLEPALWGVATIVFGLVLYLCFTKYGRSSQIQSATRNRVVAALLSERGAVAPPSLDKNSQPKEVQQ